MIKLKVLKEDLEQIKQDFESLSDEDKKRALSFPVLWRAKRIQQLAKKARGISAQSEKEKEDQAAIAALAQEPKGSEEDQKEIDSKKLENLLKLFRKEWLRKPIQKINDITQDGSPLGWRKKHKILIDVIEKEIVNSKIGWDAKVYGKKKDFLNNYWPEIEWLAKNLRRIGPRTVSEFNFEKLTQETTTLIEEFYELRTSK